MKKTLRYKDVIGLNVLQTDVTFVDGGGGILK